MIRKIIFYLILISKDYVYSQSQVDLSVGAGFGSDNYTYHKGWEPYIDKFQKPFSTLTFFPVIGLKYLLSRCEFNTTIAYSERKFEFLNFPINGFPPVNYYYYKSIDYAFRFSYNIFSEFSIGATLQYSFINKIKYTFSRIPNLDVPTNSDAHSYFIGYHLAWRHRNVDIKLEYLPHSVIFPKGKEISHIYYPINHTQRIQIIASYSFKLFEIKNKRKSRINCPKM